MSHTRKNKTIQPVPVYAVRAAGRPAERIQGVDQPLLTIELIKVLCLPPSAARAAARLLLTENARTIVTPEWSVEWVGEMAFVPCQKRARVNTTGWDIQDQMEPAAHIADKGPHAE